MKAISNSNDEQRSLVSRLREYYTDDESTFEIRHPICDEAAAEIERLIGEIEELRRPKHQDGRMKHLASSSPWAAVDSTVLARAIYDALGLANQQAFIGEFTLDGDVTVDSRFNFQAVASFLLIKMNDLAAKLQAVVSSEMVDVGVRVLRESGFLWGNSSADHLLVREMLEKVLCYGD